jgi:glyoxylase-like metal-dependent hydrolase (beta-lactamase superfamily II)
MRMKIHKFVFSPISVNTYVVSDPDGACAVIDCGSYDEAEFSRLTDYIERNNLKPEILLNTHCHLDHIFGNGMFFRKYGLKTMACLKEEENRINSQNHAMLFGMEMETPPEIGTHLANGQIVSFGKIELKAIYVPGHTAGSIAYYSKEEGCVFTGDALFAGGIGRTDLPGGNYEQLIESIRSGLLSLPEETVVYPGHGDSSTIGIEKTTNRWLS